MNLLQRALSRRPAQPGESRFGWNDYVNLFTHDGIGYPYGLNTTLSGTQERIEGHFEGAVAGAYKRSGVVFACILARLLVFSEARFQFQKMRSGRPGDLFGDASLSLLERPWSGGTTGDLLARMEQDVSLAGNCYLTVRKGRIRRMRPDWVTIVLGVDGDPDADATHLDAEVLGYIYQPGGYANGDAVPLLRSEVAHYAPIPDPVASYRGMSWLSTVLREVEADQAATTHKLKFFENGATPNMVVSMDAKVTQEAFERFVARMDVAHQGVHNAYKTLYLGGGADVKVVGSDFEQMSFKAVQAMGETRIAAAAGVPPVIVGLSEGLQAATYSNYAQARRRFADGTLRPLWRNAAGSLETLIQPPSGARLWYDDRDIPFLREDAEQAAEIMAKQAATIRTLTDAGYTADSAKATVLAGDFSLLQHSGLFSVQLQPPGSAAPAPDDTTGNADGGTAEESE